MRAVVHEKPGDRRDPLRFSVDKIPDVFQTGRETVVNVPSVPRVSFSTLGLCVPKPCAPAPGSIISAKKSPRLDLAR
jgi:hypothetical protein